ncbi:hypothetical protein [Mariniplasma anaerobium]|uniref:Pr6Pr family membrane protein n=1 Tax=Mariniplasma anaerobium TaxID=2735436 RepID=A0A7U9TJC3_9MOLU|nr:hypothetical protein [Mariniplasma anaerobium]BCR36006.1 hypothetical protein MPAN_008990 [Mariniplasma anaerobium]
MIRLLKYKYHIAFLVFLSGLYGISLEVIRAFNSSNFGEFILVTSFYFTTQTNLFLTITSLFFILKLHNKSWYKYLIFITLVNVLVTAIIFHILLAPYMENIELIQHVLHTVNPLLFIIFYFLFYEQVLPIKKFWICLIYPVVFLISVYLIIEPFYGDLMVITMPDFNSARYVYPFLDPETYSREWLGLWSFIFVIIAPFIAIISFISMWLKHKIDTKFIFINNKKA